MGLAAYYCRFIPHFAKVVGPLHTLTVQVFEKLKELPTSSPVLAFPDFNVLFMLETDASLQALGVVLAQQQSDKTVKPIAYASRCLQPHERNYGITEPEGLGVVWAVKHF